MILSNIIVYPIKGLGGIELLQAEIGPCGLRYDRRYMLVDESGHFISQREYPQLAKFRASLHESGFHFSFAKDEGASVIVPYISEGPTMKVHIWDDVVEAQEADDMFHDYFSDLLGEPCKLVYLGNDSGRMRTFMGFEDAIPVSFADAAPVLIVTEASVKDIGSKVGETISWNRFRPNIVVASTIPFEEDEWREVEIGSARLHFVKKCGRCSVITIDPESAQISVEPLKTLSHYRREGNSVCFGSYYFSNEEAAHIYVGDKLKVISRVGINEEF